MPRRPPRRWWRKTVRELAKRPGIYDPEAAAGALWYHEMTPAAKRRALSGERNPTRYIDRERRFGKRASFHHVIVFTPADTTEFARAWPNSIAGGRRVRVEFDPRGDLVDLHVSGYTYDPLPSDELSALLEHFGFTPQGFAIRKKSLPKRSNPSWPFKPGTPDYHDHEDAIEFLSHRHVIDYGTTRAYIETGKIRVDGKLYGPKQTIELAKSEGWKSIYSGVPKHRPSIGDDPEFLARSTVERWKGRTRNPRARRAPLVRYSDTEIHTWFERDRAHVELRNKRTQVTVAEWWDEEVGEEVEAGFLDPRDWHRSAYETAVYRGMIRENPRTSSSTRISGNPRHSRVSSGSVASAARLRRKFVGRDATRAELVEIPDPPEACALLGELVQLNYRATKKQDGNEGTEYYHRFSRPRPRLVADPGGKRLYIAGGRYKVTGRGIVH